MTSFVPTASSSSSVLLLEDDARRGNVGDAHGSGRRGQLSPLAVRPVSEGALALSLLGLRHGVHVVLDLLDVAEHVGENAGLVGPHGKVCLAQRRVVRLSVDEDGDASSTPEGIDSS